MVPEINKFSLNFPHASKADVNGIVAWGGDLTPARLIEAYKNGIFPWYKKDEPILWWSPNPRLIMELSDFKLRRSLKKRIKKFTYKFNTRFEEVMRKCGTIQRDGQDDSWIQEDMIDAYVSLNAMSIAHCIEAYENEELVGGVYGLSIGKIFCGESMFTKSNDASKSAYAVLIEHLKSWGYHFVDCQIPTNHLKSLGAKEISRENFLNRVEMSSVDYCENYWEINEDIIKKIG